MGFTARIKRQHAQRTDTVKLQIWTSKFLYIWSAIVS